MSDRANDRDVVNPMLHDAPTEFTPQPVCLGEADARPVVSAETRHVSPYSRSEKIGRMLWAVVQATLFRCSFHTWNGWRIWLLNRFGAHVHPTCVVRRTVRVECPWNLTLGRNSCLGDRVIAYCLGPVVLGERVSVSQHAHLCAGSHDYTKPDMPLLRPPITIGDDVWIAADAFVGPGVTLGRGAIVGARAAVFRDVPSGIICGGNPAKPLGPRRGWERATSERQL